MAEAVIDEAKRSPVPRRTRQRWGARLRERAAVLVAVLGASGDAKLVTRATTLGSDAQRGEVLTAFGGPSALPILAALIVSPNVLAPRDRDTFFAMLEHGLKVAGATAKLFSEPALEVIWRISQGIPRIASRLLRASLMLAHDRDLRFVDEHIVLDACDELRLERPSLDFDPGKSRGKRGTKSRG